MKDQESNLGAHGVIWITGYSGAGKTTIARKVTSQLKELGTSTIFLDGDDLRSIFSNRWGYERDQRVELARIYFRLCSHLASQEITVVIAAGAMYDEVREWLHTNVSGGIQVYLRVPEEERRSRDASTKKIYGVVGDLSSLYDEPVDADLVLDNSATADPNDVAKTIVKHYLQTPHDEADKGRTKYWDRYYEKTIGELSHSTFAEHVSKKITRRGTLLEIGCGNGRDAAFFSNLGLSVTAVDISHSAIELCQKTHAGLAIDFVQGNVSSIASKLPSFDYIYCRFALHAMRLHEEIDLLRCAHELLRDHGQLFIECRSINDPLARRGEVLSPTERIDGHYRRFIVLEELKSRLEAAGLTVNNAIESDGLATLGDDDPVVIRLTAQKTP